MDHILLTLEKQFVDRHLQLVQDIWLKVGVSIIFNGWRDQRSHTLIMVIVICSQGTILLNVFYWSEER